VDELVDIAAALADHSRVRALWACRRGELCACQIIALLGLAPSTVSRHMAILRQAGLIIARKDGRWMHYRLPTGPEASPLARKAIDLAFASLERTDTATTVDDAMARITAMDPEDLCRLQKANDPACCSFAPATPAAARWPKAGPATSTPRVSKRSAPARGRRG